MRKDEANEEQEKEKSTLRFDNFFSELNNFKRTARLRTIRPNYQLFYVLTPTTTTLADLEAFESTLTRERRVTRCRPTPQNNDVKTIRHPADCHHAILTQKNPIISGISVSRNTICNVELCKNRLR